MTASDGTAGDLISRSPLEGREHSGAEGTPARVRRPLTLPVLRPPGAVPELAFLAGCAPTPVVVTPPGPEKEVAVPVVVEVPPPEDMKQLAELIAYGQRVSQMTADEQKRELSAASQAQGRDKSVYARLRLATLLSLPGAAIQDDARALTLLEPYATPGGAGPLRQYAGLLHGHVAERIKEQRRTEQLKDQLEALRAVERSLIDRGLESQPRKP